MATKKSPSVEGPTIRETIQTSDRKNARSSRKKAAPESAVAKRCEDCHAANAFQAWRSFKLTPAFNVGINFSVAGIPSSGKRAVIELVTATITVPGGERARLRMYTSLGIFPSNLDLVLIPQGTNVLGQEMLVATHSLRVYTDNEISFNVHRDNAQTEGTGFICISGYLADI